MTQTHQDQRILSEQVRHVYRLAVQGLLANLLNAGILCVVLWGVFAPERLLAWFGLMLAVSLVRYFKIRHYSISQPGIELATKWQWHFILGASVSGAVWGLGALLLFPAESPPHQVFMVIILAGTMAGAMPLLAVLPRAYLFYLLSALLPFAGILFAQPDGLHQGMVFVVVLFIVVLLVSGNRLRETMALQLQLRFDNADLVDSMARVQEKLSASNEDLQLQIEERQRVEDALREQEASLADAQQLAHLGNWVWLPLSGRFTWSDALYGILGLRAGAINGDMNDFIASLHLEDQAGFSGAMQRLSEDGTPVQLELRVLRPDGELRIMHCQAKAQAYSTDGRVQRVLGTVQDITERHQAEHIKDEFISTVSHELRTPLTAIHGSLGLLAKGATGTLQGQTLNMVEVAYSNSQRLVCLVNDLLDMEKIASGKMRISLLPLQLDDLLQKTLQETLPYAASFSVHLELQAADKAVWVQANPERLQQVVTNLLSNAVKFSPPGGHVELTYARQGGGVRISVIDHGIGIPEEFQHRLFEKFTQLEQGSTRNVTGTGLGLAISKSLVEMMSGTIGFTSEPGRETCFYVDLPAANPPPGPQG